MSLWIPSLSIRPKRRNPAHLGVFPLGALEILPSGDIYFPQIVRFNPSDRQWLPGSPHFEDRLIERHEKLTGGGYKRLTRLHKSLSARTARTGGLHGVYAIQFTGEHGCKGDYLVVSIRRGVLEGFITVLVDQWVIVPDTKIILASDVLPLPKE